MDQLNKFYQNTSCFPGNVEVVTMQVGHQSDFIDECAYLKLALQYIKQEKIDELTATNYTEFSTLVNAPIGNQTKKQLTKIEINESNLDFKDVGDINTVIYPVALLERRGTDNRLVNMIEERLQLSQKPDLQKRLQKLKQVEIDKEIKLKKLIDNIQNDKQALRIDIGILSYLNFQYPNGNLDKSAVGDQTYAEINEVCQYTSDEQKKQFLEKLQLDEVTLAQKLKDEITNNNMQMEEGVL